MFSRLLPGSKDVEQTVQGHGMVGNWYPPSMETPQDCVWIRQIRPRLDQANRDGQPLDIERS